MKRYVIKWRDTTSQEEGYGTEQLPLEEALVTCEEANKQFPWINHIAWLVPNLDNVCHS